MTTIDPFEPDHFEQIDQLAGAAYGAEDEPVLTSDEIAAYERVDEALLDAEHEARREARARDHAEEDEHDGPTH
ncbi:hypothetical protein ACFV85_14885 [Streptomyces niveus]|uniref:hypothetical protein n=1 Tax=Streptomyces niveus TaxID=193462 RepID=UPI003653CB7C